MITAAKRLSQVAVHMGIAYVLAYAMSGSAFASGLAVIAEPLINVLLLPFHESAWDARRRKIRTPRGRYMTVLCEKLSQAVMHAGVAFGVMYAATGSLAVGGLAALVEPVCNVLVLPLHDRMWDNVSRAHLENLQPRGA